VSITNDQITSYNETYMQMCADDGMRKQAEDDGSNYIRQRVRESGFGRKVLPAEEKTGGFDRSVTTPKPIVIVDKESPTDWAVTVGYGGTPSQFYIESRRVMITPTLIRSPKVTYDHWTMRTSKYDVRKVYADNTVKDIQSVEDEELLRTVNRMLRGVGQTMWESGSVQYRQLSGGFSRNNVAESMQVLPGTGFAIPNDVVLVNQLTWMEQLKWDRNEAGGDYSESMLKNGWKECTLFDKSVKWLVSIKHGLIPKNVQYMFGPQKFLGNSYLFRPPVMSVKYDPVGWYSFQVLEEIGTSLINSASYGRVNYT
jgi:hypothetical protein